MKNNIYYAHPLLLDIRKFFTKMEWVALCEKFKSSDQLNNISNDTAEEWIRETKEDFTYGYGLNHLEFISSLMRVGLENPESSWARTLLLDVSKRIQLYESKKKIKEVR